ncbi:hypothetical protein J6Q66_03195 [bacterium]|nr:hypothetical protein [bacterium]
MMNILNKKFAVVVMLVAFLSSLTPSFAINQATPLRTTVSNSQKDDIKAVKLVGDVNLKKGNQLISVSLRDSDVKQVLRMFADKAGLNIVFHNSVQGTVTLDLVNVTLNNAFKMIMSAAELAYYIENDTLIVTSKEADKTVGLSKSNMMVLPVKYIDATAIAEFLNKNIFGTGRSGLSNGDVAVTNPRTNEVIIFGSYNDYKVAKEIVAKMDVKPSIATFKVNHVTPKEMAGLICNTIFATNDEETNEIEDDSDSSDTEIDDQDTSLGSAGGVSSSSSSSALKNIKLGSGKIACKVNSEMESDTLKSMNMNAIVVLYYPELGNVGVIGGSVEQIQLIEEFIQSNDKKQPQAYVELQIVELTEEGSKQFNNSWNMWTPFFSVSFDGTSGLRTNPIHPTFWKGNAYGVMSSDNKSVDYVISKFSGPSTITQAIQYIIQNKKGRVLANPKIVVTNGRVSTIDLSSDYIKKVESQVMSSVMVGAVQKTYDIANDNGMTIQLVPFISTDGYVSMNIKPSYSTIKERIYSSSVAGTEEIAATLLQRRNLNLSNIRIKDGETLVLGGLVQEVETKNTTKMPILGDIPILGMFFRSSKDELSKSELVILVTPHIIKDSEDVQANVVDL